METAPNFQNWVYNEDSRVKFCRWNICSFSCRAKDLSYPNDHPNGPVVKRTEEPSLVEKCVW